MRPIERRCIVNIIKARYELLLYEDYYRSPQRPHAADARPTCGRLNAADYERRNAFLVFITNAADALRSTHCGRRIGVIAAITRQIGRMRPTVRPSSGRRIAADYERHNAFLAFITNAADARPTHDAFMSAATCGRRAADAPADYEPTFIVVRTCDVACHVLVCTLYVLYTTRQKSKSINQFAVQCTPLLVDFG